jgi:hypothetical protein
MLCEAVERLCVEAEWGFSLSGIEVAWVIYIGRIPPLIEWGT